MYVGVYVELEWGGSVTNGAKPSSFTKKPRNIGTKNTVTKQIL